MAVVEALAAVPVGGCFGFHGNLSYHAACFTAPTAFPSVPDAAPQLPERFFSMRFLGVFCLLSCLQCLKTALFLADWQQFWLTKRQFQRQSLWHGRRETPKAAALGTGGAYSMETKTSTGSSRGAASGMVGEDYMGRKTSTELHGKQNLHRAVYVFDTLNRWI
jgi:hypothetical protein